MILVDHQIRKAGESGKIFTENFSKECVQSATYDLRIGPLVYSLSGESPNKPIDLRENGGTYLLPPYGNAILMTHESLKFDANMVGRIGLKSGFARRGVFASTGPQVDPGFEGKLFVSLLNLVPRSQVLSYKETFLSIEFHTLDTTPEKIYEGPYQGRQDISPEILEDLVRMEGLNLAQVQSQFTELLRHVQEWSALATRFDEFLTEMKSHTEAIKNLTQQRTSVVQSKELQDEIVHARKVSLSEVIKEISELFQKKGKLFYSDIAEELCLDYDIVVKACKQLQKNGIIEEMSNVSKKSQKTRK